MTSVVRAAKAGADALQEETERLRSSPASSQEDVQTAMLLNDIRADLFRAASRAGESASRLVTCAKVVVCTMEQPESQQQLISTAKDVSLTPRGGELLRGLIDGI